MPDPLAYFITWTTYGTWLHGDDRGSVDKSNASPGIDYLAANPARETYCRQQMRSAAVRLTPDQIAVVKRTIERHCELRDWRLIALSCRPQHVHVIVHTDGTPPERVMGEFKAYATRALREAGLAGKHKLWTSGGSTRYIWSETTLNDKVQYVRYQ